MKKNRIFYFILFLCSLDFVYFYGGKIPYMLFYIVVLLPVLSIIHIIIIFFRFKYTQEIDKKLLVKGDKVNFIFKMSNEDMIFYPYINVTFCGSENIFFHQFEAKSFSIAPFKQRKYNFELTCNYRGTYEVGLQAVNILDFLGIFKLSYRVFEPKLLTVYPRVVPIERFSLKTVHLSETNSILNNSFKDSTTISDIREYTNGDHLKKIHWKVSAKMNKLMVKNFQSTSETCATIFLDLKKNPFSFELNTIVEDKVIEAAVSVLHYCLSNWIPVDLVYFKDAFVNIEAKNPLDFEEIYKIFSKISFNQKIEIKDILDIYIHEKINYTNMIIFTSNVDYSLYNQLYKIKFSGYDIILIYISPDEISGISSVEANNIISFLPEIDVNTYKIEISDDIKVALERYI